MLIRQLRTFPRIIAESYHEAHNCVNTGHGFSEHVFIEQRANDETDSECQMRVDIGSRGYIESQMRRIVLSKSFINEGLGTTFCACCECRARRGYWTVIYLLRQGRGLSPETPVSAAECSLAT